MQGSQPVLLLWWCRYHRRSRRRSRRMPELQGTSVMAVSVTDEWVNSTRSFGSFIRGRPCGVSAVYSVPLCLTWRVSWPTVLSADFGGQIL